MQLRDKLTVKPSFFGSEGEMQHFYLLVEMLIDCRRGASPHLEAQLRDTIEACLDSKRMAQGIHKMAGESQALDYPKFLRKLDNPATSGAEASGYRLHDCYDRGLEMLRRSMKAHMQG